MNFKSTSESLFKSGGNWLNSYSYTAQIFYDTVGCNFLLIMKGAAVIQHLSVVNTIHGDILVSWRGKKWSDQMWKTVGFLQEAERKAAANHVCPQSWNTVKVNTQTGKFSVNAYQIYVSYMWHYWLIAYIVVIQIQTIQKVLIFLSP